MKVELAPEALDGQCHAYDQQEYTASKQLLTLPSKLRLPEIRYEHNMDFMVGLTLRAHANQCKPQTWIRKSACLCNDCNYWYRVALPSMVTVRDFPYLSDDSHLKAA